MAGSYWYSLASESYIDHNSLGAIFPFLMRRIIYIQEVEHGKIGDPGAGFLDQSHGCLQLVHRKQLSPYLLLPIVLISERGNRFPSETYSSLISSRLV